MIRKGKLYSRPKKLYEKKRIAEENLLAKKYALKSKREIWRTLAKVNYYRSRAKSLAKASSEEQHILFTKLQALGLHIRSIADILALRVEDLLERRLSTIVFKKGLAATPQQARQMIVHRKVLIHGKSIDAPSYLVPVSEESAITARQIVQKAAKPEPAPEASP